MATLRIKLKTNKTRVKLKTNEKAIRINTPQVTFFGTEIEPIGTIDINANGIYNVKYLEFANINVPIPEGYIKPYGVIEIKNTNEIDVSEFEKAKIVDENLKPENIAENQIVLGIIGTFKGGMDTSDATATADKIFENEIAYNNDGKVVGTFTIKEELTTQEQLVEQIKLALIGKMVGGNVVKEEWLFTLTDGTIVNKTIIKEE